MTGVQTCALPIYLPSASVSFNEEPFTLATTISEKDTAVGFIMPSLDEVEYTDKVIRAFSEAGIEMLDLTKGLTPIKPMSENSSNEDIEESYQTTDVADIAARVKEIVEGVLPEATVKGIDALIRASKGA